MKQEAAAPPVLGALAPPLTEATSRPTATDPGPQARLLGNKQAAAETAGAPRPDPDWPNGHEHLLATVEAPQQLLGAFQSPPGYDARRAAGDAPQAPAAGKVAY
jgi:hypothetical protein